MMISNTCMKESFNLINVFRKFKYDIIFNRTHPTYFHPDGLVVFVGGQGTGKTLSAVNYTYSLLDLYPKAKIVTNINLVNYPTVTFKDYVRNHPTIKEYLERKYEDEHKRVELFYKLYLKCNRVFPFINADDLQRYKNGQEGVIFLIDEIHVYFNSLQSKNINMDVMTLISQQRKQRIHIVATCQVFGRMAKPLREQFSNVVLCKSYFNVFQRNQLIDRDSIQGEESTGTNLTGEVIKNFWFVRSPDMFKRYDTYAVIENKELSVSTDKQDIYNLGGVTV